MRGRLDILADAAVALILFGVLYALMKWIGEW
jgi:hypothetical protein